MSGAATIDYELDDDALTVSFVIGGYDLQTIKQMGGMIDSVPLRFMGALQDEATGAYKSLEIVDALSVVLPRISSPVICDHQVDQITSCPF